ncbi:24877_t:CDS:2 [Gigaspora margarita]|uniref:24877_t:CDS:1 n=1 Tax=Gigaspora margarita TaxID=4874 RepID=A0ABN7WX83_GIGMA|nr:24877_t:CDS:2 [Gigaspora margarita]
MYLTNESQFLSTLSKEKLRSHKLFLYSTSAKKSNNNTIFVNFSNIVFQVHLSKHSSKSNNLNPVPKTTKQNNSSDANSSNISFLDTKNDIDTFANSNKPAINTSANLTFSQNKNTK